MKTAHTVPWPHCPNKNVFSNRRNSLYDMSASFRCDGRLFHSPGPAAPNALSPKVLYVCVTTHVRLAVERSRRSRASATIRVMINTHTRFFWFNRPISLELLQFRLPRVNFGNYYGRISIGQMPFLSPSQQHESTKDNETNTWNNFLTRVTKILNDMFPTNICLQYHVTERRELKCNRLV